MATAMVTLFWCFERLVMVVGRLMMMGVGIGMDTDMTDELALLLMYTRSTVLPAWELVAASIS